MADAVLSDGSELLLQQRNFDASDNAHDDEQCPTEHLPSEINCDRAFQLEQPPENNPSVLELSESEQADSNRFVIRRDNRNAYQRRSYDDRQLPPVVSIDREIPWYQNSVMSSSSELTNNNNQTPAASIADNNNVLRSPTSSANSISSASSSATPVRKKNQRASVFTSANIMEQQQRRFSKKASFSGRRNAKMTSSSTMDSALTKEQLSEDGDNQLEYNPNKVSSNDHRSPVVEKSGFISYMESVNNNNTSSKLKDSKNPEKVTESTGSDSAWYRKLPSNKKRTSRNSRDSSG